MFSRKPLRSLIRKLFRRKPAPELPILYNLCDGDACPLADSSLYFRFLRGLHVADLEDKAQILQSVIKHPELFCRYTLYIETNKGLFARAFGKVPDYKYDGESFSSFLKWDTIYAGQKMLIGSAYIVHANLIVGFAIESPMTLNAGDKLNITFNYRGLA